MKKFFVSAGLAAIGAASLHADVYAPDVTAMDASKIWSLSGTLRGFYDDNYTTLHSDATGKRASSGFEISPSLCLIVPLQQTELGLRYTYGLYYYQDRENMGANPIDQTHEVDLWIDHAFSERWEGKVQDTFISAQDPQLTAAGNPLPYRAEGNNIQNVGTLTLHTEWSLLFSTDLGYQNTYTDYSQHGASTDPLSPQFVGDGSGATYAGLLNGEAHLIWLNFNYQYLPDLVFLVGYQFGLNQYLGNEPIAQQYIGSFPVPGNFYYSDNRDSFSNYGYLGLQYSMTANLSATVQAGVQFSDQYNLPSWDNQPSSQPQPYANIAVTYTYLPGDYVQGGFTQSENSANISDVNPANGYLTLYEETSVLYASVNHQITPKLLASVIGHFQYSEYQGGAYDGGSQDWSSVGVNFTYSFNPFFSAEVRYNFDYVTSAGSGAAPSYTRNREYIGVTANY